MIRLLIFCLSLIITQVSTASSGSKNADHKNLREQFFMARNATSSCIKQLKSPENDAMVHGQILAPLSKANEYSYLFNSEETLSDEQVETLKSYLEVRKQCRFYYFQMPLKTLVNSYISFYAEIDNVYEALIAKELTIGEANKKRLELSESLQSVINEIFKSFTR